jgi:hypothetical protein
MPDIQRFLHVKLPISYSSYLYFVDYAGSILSKDEFDELSYSERVNIIAKMVFDIPGGQVNESK